MKSARSRSLPLFSAWILTSCGSFFEDDSHDFDEPRGSEQTGRRHPGKPGTPPALCDASNASGEDGGTPDTGELPPDLGDRGDGDAGATPDAGECASSLSCPAGSECLASVCEPCPEGICPCRRDNDCPSDQICDHARGVCEAPVIGCADLATEAECLARADCQAIYAGRGCRDSLGGDCTADDSDCTCESYSFALCEVRGTGP